jgi:hypothetical protein
MLEFLCAILCLTLAGMMAAAYMHMREMQQQAYIHGAIAGAAMGASALYLLKTQPGAVRNVVDDVEWGQVGKQATAAFRHRVGNLADMFATATPTAKRE